MFVIGTAGHVDHGKSTLVKALSGIDPDRLREEKERQMTIDLGFAWLTLPSGREVSVVDVPGHEDFVRNMLAGVGGIDLALLVVSGDESVMPQTREHVAILDLLEIPRGVVAISRIDLVDDPEWLDLVAEELREELAGTSLAAAPIVRVSAVTGEGLPELLAAIDEQLGEAEPRPDLGRPRLPVDRVFTISGFGTIVTGTLIDGHLSVGDPVEIVGAATSGGSGREGLSARIRGLQSHKTKVDVAEPGSRVAVNLSGVDVDDMQRGDVVTCPGWLRTTDLVDARLRYLANAPWPLRHNAEVELFCGSSRALAHVRLLDCEQVQPGETVWVQYRLSEPMAMVRGDGYIVRVPSPSVTVGGGIIVQPHPRHRHRRFRDDVIAQLEALASGSSEDILLMTLRRLPGSGVAALSTATSEAGLQAERAKEALAALVDDGRVIVLGDEEASADGNAADTYVMASSAWDAILGRVREWLQEYHARHKLRLGMPREELKSRLSLEAEPFARWIEHAAAEGQIVGEGTVVRLSEHAVRLTDDQESAVARALQAFQRDPYAPPSVSQIEGQIGPELLDLLVEQGRLVKAADTVLYAAADLNTMTDKVRQHLADHERITVGEVRDLFGTSRKYAMALLEELDRRRVTKRLGDFRVLR